MLVQNGSGLATATPSVQDKLLDTCPQLTKGKVFFVPAQTSLALTSSKDSLLVWLAAVNSSVFGNKFAQPNGMAGIFQTAGVTAQA